MSDKRFRANFDVSIYDSEKEEYISVSNRGLEEIAKLMNEQQAIINKQEEIIKSQDMEISRQYNLCLAMSGILREEFGVYDVFDRTKDKNIKKEE